MAQKRRSGTQPPTDLSALASILEAAMADEPGPKRTIDIPTPENQRPTPKPPQPNPLPGPKPQGPVREAREMPPRPVETSERETVAFEEVARSLAAAEACVPLLAQATGLLRLAALDVVRAETARAGGLLQLLRFLRGDITPPVTVVSTSAVVQRLTQALESEKRLRSVGLVVRSSVADATCVGDETLLVNTLLTLLLITFAAVDGVQNARVMLSVGVNDAGDIGFAVSQDHVPPPAAWTARVADDAAVDGGQAVAGIAISGAQRLAREWRGRFALAAGDHSSILTIWLPTVTADADGLAH